MQTITERPIIERLGMEAAMLTRGRTFTARELAGKLGVSAKTIYRDLAFAATRLNWPVEVDTYGFRFSRPVALCECCRGRFGN